jgi:hypothetical protein
VSSSASNHYTTAVSTHRRTFDRHGVLDAVRGGARLYKVSDEAATYLGTVHQVPGDENSPLAFDVCTE